MGRAARWLRGLLGGGKKKAVSSGAPPEARKKKRWGSFVKSFREKEKRGEAVPVPVASYREVDGGEEEEQNKRAIAVAAATAAVAEAAVAAAQAAAAVVRLTSSGRVGGGKREEWAAVKIQAAFRAYLARRALRALKGLVKLQALVRGNIVRKQAAETLRCMQALVRVQARARACRALRSDRNQLKSTSRTHPGPATPEKSEQPVRPNARKPERSSTLRRNSSKQTCSNDAFNQDQAQTSTSELRWLDQWMEERYWDTTKPGTVAMSTPFDDEKNAKILEIDTGKPHHGGSKRKSSNYVHSSCSPLTSDQLSRSFTIMPDSPSKDSTVAQRSILSSSSVDMQSLSPLRFPVVDGYDHGESPQFFSAASSRPASSRRGPFTPAKSECSRSLFSGYSDYPNYMANTESSRAKVRSQSAPKQRPEIEQSGSTRRASAGHGLGQQQLGSGVAQRSSSSSLHAKFTNKAYPGSGRLDRLGMPFRI